MVSRRLLLDSGKFTRAPGKPQSLLGLNALVHVCLILAPVLWGGNFVIAKLAVPEIHAAWLNVFRWLVAAAIIVPFALRQIARDADGLKQSFVSLCFLSLFGIIGFNTTLYLGLQSVPASIAAIGFAMTPIFIVLIGAVLDARCPALAVALACVTSLIGVYFVVASGGAVCGGTVCIEADGLMLVFAATFMWACYCHGLKRSPINAAPLSIFASTILIGLAVQLPLAVLMFEMPDVADFSVPTISYIVYLGVGASALAFSAWGFALRLADMQSASLFLNLVPVSSVVLGFVFLGERMGLYQWVGVGLVMASLAVVQNRQSAMLRAGVQDDA